MSNRSFIFTQTNSSPFAGLDGSVTFSDGTATTDKILVIAANGLGAPPLNPQTQNAPFQQGASLIRTLFQPRTITFECAISVPAASSTGRAEVTTIKRRLSKVLSPVGMGFLPDTSLTSSNYSTWIGKLSYASDGSTYNRFIDCVPMTVEFPNAYYKDGFQKMRVVFFCPDPFWYGSNQTSTMSNVSVGISGAWFSVCWSPELSLFCAIADAAGGTANTIQTSPDGITWTSHSSTEANHWRSVTWSPALGIFCAVSSSGTNRVMTSPDGATWTPHAAAAALQWYGICWSPELNLFCATSIDGGNQQVMTSPNGSTWTRQVSAGPGNYGWQSVCWSPELGLFCSVANAPADVTNRVMTSVNGSTWIGHSAAEAASWFSVCWSPELNLFCAVNIDSTNRVMTSPDGATWTPHAASEANNWQSVTWSPTLGLFCAVSVNGTNRIMTSPNGSTWTPHLAPAGNNWQSVCWSPELGLFCSVANTTSQYPMISYDGSIWLQNSATTDWYATVNNQGDVPADFELTVPVVGGETGKVIAIGENFLWAGSGDPPSDHNIVFSTQGLKTGTVVLNTKFGSKTITQFGNSVMNNFVGGTFFSLYVSGSQSNILYLRNTGTAAAAPTFTWRNRYIDV